MKQEVLKDKSDSISFTPYLNNRPAVSSAATLRIRKPGGTDLVTAGTSATVDGTTGEISYSLSAANNATLGENYTADWTYTISGVTYYNTTLYDVVRNKLAITIVDEDLINEQRDILKKNESFTGDVDAATSTTIVDADLKSYDNDYWNNGRLRVINPSDGATQIREISDFASSTGTVTVPVAFGTTPDNTYKYIVTKGFSDKIEIAYEEMIVDIKQKGYRPALILESSDLKIPHVKKTLELICRDYSDTPDDKWAELEATYMREYRDYMSKVKLQYDASEGGLIDSDETDTGIGAVRMRR